MQSLRWSSCLVALALAVCLPACGADPLQQAAASQPVPPAQLTAEQDHQRTMELLHIPSLRAGANGSNPAVHVIAEPEPPEKEGREEADQQNGRSGELALT